MPLKTKGESSPSQGEDSGIVTRQGCAVGSVRSARKADWPERALGKAHLPA